MISKDNKTLMFLAAFTVVLCGILIFHYTDDATEAEVPLLFIGIDGATWKFIDPLLENGQLPTFERLIKNGVRGQLQTLTPTQSVIIWSSIVTGCLPEHHGIKGWLSGAGDQLAITSDMRKRAALWDILDYHGLSGHYINWWTSWPPSIVKGTVISNLFEFARTENRVYPSEKLALADRIYKNAINDAVTKGSAFSSGVNNLSMFRKDHALFTLARELYTREPTECLALYVRGLDITEHEYYHYAKPAEFPEVPPSYEEKKDIINDYYRMLDVELDILIKSLKTPANIVIVSDHGMEALSKDVPPIGDFLCNNLLDSLGLLKKRDEYSLDWEKTTLFQYGYHLPALQRELRLNIQGRDPHGIIEAKDFEIRREEYITILRDLNVRKKDDPKTVIPLFTVVAKIGNNSADIHCELNVSVRPQDELLLGPETVPINAFLTHFLRHSSGQHDDAPPGILIFSGPSFKKGITLQKCHVTDVLPTVLSALALPMSDEMDGHVLEPALRRTPQYDQNLLSYPKARLYQPKSGSIPDQVQSKIRNELKSLGYIQ